MSKHRNRCEWGGEPIRVNSRGKPVYRCVREGCDIEQAVGPDAVSKVCRSGRPPRTELRPCRHRGKQIGFIEKCGCGFAGGMPVYECHFIAEEYARPHPHCTPFTMGIRARWQIEGVTRKPVACSTCRDCEAEA